MTSYLQIENLTKSIGDRMLFADVTLGIYEGDKIGIVARNGAGKSTFLNIICGREDYDSGRIVFSDGIRVGYLAQQEDFDPGMSVLDYVTPPPADDDDFDNADRATRMLTQFGLTDTSLPMRVLSGGQIKRAALARVLLSAPDLLILDEPTNHLDIEIIEWLEQYLTRQRITLIMVTHDRYFLDKICNKIIEIDREQVFTYEGNYDYYLAKRDERMQNLTAELSKVRNLLRTELEWMRRQPQARGSKAKYRIDNFHELERRSQVNLREDNVSLNVKASYIGSKIFEARNVSKSFGDKCILRDWSYTFARREKVGIVGPNGVGKSTFIHLLLGELTADSGSFDIGTTVRWGYYRQEGMTDFDDRKKVIDAVREIAETVRIDEKTTLTAQQFLTHFLFSPATQQKYIGKLSGGERRRLYLATVLMRQPNFLILDEPTNDLDILTLTILEDYLARFNGCVIVVSHDRFFLDRIVDHLFVFTGDGHVRDFPGDYSTYRHCVAEEEKEQRRLAEEKAVARPSRSTAPAPVEDTRRANRAPRLSYKEKKEMEALETELETLGAEKTRLETEMSSGTMTVEAITAAGARIAELIARTDEAELRLLELMEKES